MLVKQQRVMREVATETMQVIFRQLLTTGAMSQRAGCGPARPGAAGNQVTHMTPDAASWRSHRIRRRRWHIGQLLSLPMAHRLHSGGAAVRWMREWGAAVRWMREWGAAVRWMREWGAAVRWMRGWGERGA